MKFFIRFLYIIEFIIGFPTACIIFTIGLFSIPIVRCIQYIISGKIPTYGNEVEPWFIKLGNKLIKINYEI